MTTFNFTGGDQRARWGFGAANQSRPYARKKAKAFNTEQRDCLVYHNRQSHKCRCGGEHNFILDVGPFDYDQFGTQLVGEA